MLKKSLVYAATPFLSTLFEPAAILWAFFHRLLDRHDHATVGTNAVTTLRRLQVTLDFEMEGHSVRLIQLTPTD